MKRSLFAILSLALFVAAAGAQTITVTKPAAGETVVKGTGYTIMWTKTGTMGANVRITLRNAATLAEVQVIADPAPNTGSFAWQMPGDIPDGSYKIRVKVKNEAVSGDSGAFTIKTGPKVYQPLASAAKDVGIALKFPALSIYQAGLVPYDDKFMVTFGYKNSGTGPLPKSSEMPIKPSFRVLVDNREVNQGSLSFPAFPAPPGWEVPTFYACDLKRQASGIWDPTIAIGNQLTVKINENKVNGMAGDSQTYNLRTMALNYAPDLMISEVTLDWNTGVLTATIRLDGVYQANDEIRVWNRDDIILAGTDYWHMTAKAVPGQHVYTLSRKRDGLKGQNDHKVALRAFLYRNSDATPSWRDIDHRNNDYERVFHR